MEQEPLTMRLNLSITALLCFLLASCQKDYDTFFINLGEKEVFLRFGKTSESVEPGEEISLKAFRDQRKLIIIYDGRISNVGDEIKDIELSWHSAMAQKHGTLAGYGIIVKDKHLFMAYEKNGFRSVYEIQPKGFPLRLNR